MKPTTQQTTQRHSNNRDIDLGTFYSAMLATDRPSSVVGKVTNIAHRVLPWPYNGVVNRAALYFSADHGRTWTLANVR